MPTITLGVPTLNGADRLRQALESVAAWSEAANGHRLKDMGVRVLVCDDGSREEDLRGNRGVIAQCAPRLPGLELLTNDERRGISKSWNRLARDYGDSDVVILMNDDFELVQHAIEAMVYAVRENPAVGVVGLNSYVSITRNQRAALFPGALPHVLDRRVDYCESNLMDGGGSLLSAQGPCFAFRRDAFDLVGGFDERYFCYFEELDFACSLRRKGLHSFMASYPLGYHQGGVTNTDTRNIDAAHQMKRSRELFIEKWGKTPDGLREEFRASYQRPALREWSTQIQNWK